MCSRTEGPRCAYLKWYEAVQTHWSHSKKGQPETRNGPCMLNCNDNTLSVSDILNDPKSLKHRRKAQRESQQCSTIQRRCCIRRINSLSPSGQNSIQAAKSCLKFLIHEQITTCTPTYQKPSATGMLFRQRLFKHPP